MGEGASVVGTEEPPHVFPVRKFPEEPPPPGASSAHASAVGLLQLLDVHIVTSLMFENPNITELASSIDGAPKYRRTVWPFNSPVTATQTLKAEDWEYVIPLDDEAFVNPKKQARLVEDAEVGMEEPAHALLARDQGATGVP
jgi:hypothetical protein